jgi:hypothetical protein
VLQKNKAPVIPDQDDIVTLTMRMTSHLRRLIGLHCVLVVACLAMASSAFAEQAADDAVITLERTVCYGTCPSYKVTLTGDGTVVYEGQNFVRVQGRQEKKIHPAAESGDGVLTCARNGLISSANLAHGKKREAIEERFRKTRELLVRAGAPVGTSADE